MPIQPLHLHWNSSSCGVVIRVLGSCQEGEPVGWRWHPLSYPALRDQRLSTQRNCREVASELITNKPHANVVPAS